MIGAKVPKVTGAQRDARAVARGAAWVAVGLRHSHTGLEAIGPQAALQRFRFGACLGEARRSGSCSGEAIREIAASGMSMLALSCGMSTLALS